jgi:hypothetical protein
MHRKALLLAALLLVALASLPADVIGQAKNQKNKAEPATPQDYYLIQNQKSLTGQLLSFDDSSHAISVRIDFPEWVPNPKYRPNTGAQHSLLNDYNRMQQEAARMANTRNPRTAQQHYNNMMNLQNRIAIDMARANSFNPNNPPFMQLHHLKDFDFETQEKIAYRKMFLPQEYDDTGNVKTYSKEEKAKLKGDNKPAGSYSATPGEFHPGQGVWVYLIPPKKLESSSSSSSSAAAKEKDKDKEGTETKDDTVPRPTVKMLVIYEEGTLAPTTKDNPKKKN